MGRDSGAGFAGSGESVLVIRATDTLTTRRYCRAEKYHCTALRPFAFGNSVNREDRRYQDQGQGPFSPPASEFHRFGLDDIFHISIT